MTILTVQCRLDSTRLPQKALLPLCGKPILSWVLSAMKKVNADRYFLATDEDSAEKLFPIAKENGFECFCGPKNDVLKRFCLLIKETGAQKVIRVTGDNPFLMYESVIALTEQFNSHSCDYITWTGLPHGSGAEMFLSKSLLHAADLTNLPYDCEHVGPALYNYPERFHSVIMQAPEQWHFPQYRTTVDTKADFKSAQRLARVVLKKRGVLHNQMPIEPFTAQEIIYACKIIENPILLIPCVQKGKGTGHLRRAVQLAAELEADIFIPKQNADQHNLENVDYFTSKLETEQIQNELPQSGEYSLFVTDAFSIESNFAQKLWSISPVFAIDEGSSNTEFCDYLLDIIPSHLYVRKPNLCKSSFINTPKNRKNFPKKIEKVLIVIGGEDPAKLTLSAVNAFAGLHLNITAVMQNNQNQRETKGVTFVSHIENLIEQLYTYDLVVTHYGFTAFEAVAAGCAVLLLGTSPLHVQLSKHIGFTVLEKDEITQSAIQKLLQKKEKLFPQSKELAAIRTEHAQLSDFIKETASCTRIDCPVCGKLETNGMSIADEIYYRTQKATFRRCKNCGMIYQSWSAQKQKNYNESYFFEEYKNQYGKTYLEDFNSIKMQGVRRCTIIDSLFWQKKSRTNTVPALLDIGCAYGPFLSAASDMGWHVYGTDISQEAVTYVKNTLKFEAALASFPAINSDKEFGRPTFDAITMWYVIEHFTDVDIVLKTAASMLNSGGIFAFSTPSAAGISARFRKAKFFQNSPVDHYTLWEPKKAAIILAEYGFKIEKKISTGQHPERLPFIKKNRLKNNSVLYRILSYMIKLFSLGDTFEIYCRKI